MRIVESEIGVYVVVSRWQGGRWWCGKGEEACTGDGDW